MTITELKGFYWLNNRPVNYNNKKVKWPKTQETKAIQRLIVQCLFVLVKFIKIV